MGQNSSTPSRNDRSAPSASAPTHASQPSHSHNTPFPSSSSEPSNRSNDLTNSNVARSTRTQQNVSSQRQPSRLTHALTNNSTSTSTITATATTEGSTPFRRSTAPSSSGSLPQYTLASSSNSPLSTQSSSTPPPATPSTSTSSRVLRSVTERRRRANLFSSFYPLLSRNSSASSSGNSSPDINGPSTAPSNTATTTTSSSTATSSTSGPSSNLRASPTVNGRTPRGLHRVQRMHDEQSIRSNRSSSRASSVVAIAPSPDRSNHYRTAAEDMDVDTEPVSHLVSPHIHTTHSSQHEEILQDDVPMALASTPRRLSMTMAQQDVMTELAQSLSFSTEPTASVIETNSLQNDSGHLHFASLFSSMPNPRGGTSISSSLLPIRPDSDDEVDGHEWDDTSAVDTNAPISNQGSNSERTRNAYSLGTGHDVTGFRPRRRPGVPGPELIADLIQDQFAQHEDFSRSTRLEERPTLRSRTSAQSIMSSTGASTGSHVPHDHQQSQEPQQGHEEQNRLEHSRQDLQQEHGQHQPQQESEGSESNLRMSHYGHPSASHHRRRLRSSSVRGMMGFQPTGHSAASDNESTPSASTVLGGSERQEEPTRLTGAGERPHFAMSHLPFLTRLLADISRGMMPPGQGESNEMPSTTEQQLRVDSLNRDTAFDSANTDRNDRNDGNDVPSTSTEGNAGAAESGMGHETATATPSRRRHATTIRIFQIGGGLPTGMPDENRLRDRGTDSDRDPEPDTAVDTEAWADTNATAEAGVAADEQNEQNDGNQGEASERDRVRGRRERGPGEVFIMFLGHLGAEPAANTQQNEPEPVAEGQPRSRAPWVVVSISGACAEGGGGLGYEDLWMLSNLIGPARPVTTTQEAINSAGFSVGKFEQEIQGMRGYPTLGDGTRCLVCMSEYEEGEDMRALKCRHGFHQECIDK
ncbi:hypothetical protein BGZ94_003630, partial [Podila epigama]